MHKHYHESLKETYYTKQLRNGLEVVILPKDTFQTTQVSLSIPYGNHHLDIISNDKHITLPLGSAHFFEHKIYASESGDMFAKFVQYGIEPNAMTSYDYTSYVFSATSNVLEGIKLLFETLDSTYFTDENIDTERDIITEEIHMNDDRTSTKMYRHLYSMLFHHHPIQHDILGTEETIKNITVETLLTMHKLFYQQSKRLLVVSGKVDLESLELFLDAYDSNKEIIPFEVKDIVEPKDIVLKEKEVFESIERPRLAMGFKFQEQKSLIDIEKIVTSLYLVLHAYIGQTSDDYQDLLDEKLIYRDLNFFIQKESHAEAVIIYAQSSNPKILQKRLLEIFEKPIEKVFTKDIFKRLNNVSLASTIEMLDDLESKVYNYTKFKLEGYDLFDIIMHKLSITYEDALEAFQLFKTSPHVSLYMFPKQK
jgi:predicted Zn-dependent peptidase